MQIYFIPIGFEILIINNVNGACHEMKEDIDNNWFETWFDSPYYHILYQNRNEEEAAIFIDGLIEFLQPNPQQRFLDLACGKGRHALQISEKGFATLGVDLSANSIEFAQQFESKLLHFAVHDMREIVPAVSFDYILNLFTSFGYFDDISDNLKMLSAIHHMLTAEGIFVLDFFNAGYVLPNIVEREEKLLSNVLFHIHKQVKEKKIVKSITFTDGGKSYHFEEKVNAFTPEDILGMLDQSGFVATETFGSYTLEPFSSKKSERFIVVAIKK